MEGKERKIGAATAQLPAGQTICYHYYCECAWRHVSAPVAKHGTASTRPEGKRHHGDATAKLCGGLATVPVPGRALWMPFAAA